MNRRSSILVVALLAAALVGVALLAIPGSPLHQKPTLGLDLQGGLEVTLQAVPPPNRDLTQEDLDRSVDIMRNRVDKLGVTEPEIRTQGDDQIVIQLPGVKDPEAAAEIIGTTAQLELYDLETSLVGPSISIRGEPVEHASLYRAARAGPVAGEAGHACRVLPREHQDRAGRSPALMHPRRRHSRSPAVKLPAGRDVFAVPEKMVVITCGVGAGVCPGGPNASGVPPDRTYYYLFKYDPPNVPQMTGEDLKLSGTRADFDTSPGSSGQPIVTMEFTGKGSDKFERITGDEWIRGKLRQQPQHFAIVLDREIKTFPQIDYTDSTLSGGIGGGRAQITGARVVPGGKGDRPRPADGRAAGQVRDARPHRYLGDPRQGLARGGPARSDRRAHPRRDFPPHLLPLPRPGRRRRSRNLRGLPVRDDPRLQRHAHAARVSRASC